MSTLKNKKIKDTYEGLLKTSTNLALTGSLTEIQDGTGQNSGVKINNLGEVELNKLKFTALEDGNAVEINEFLVSSEPFVASNTKIPTVESVKNYVDSSVTAQDLDFSADAGAGSIDLDSETLIVKGTNGLNTSVVANELIISASTLEDAVELNTAKVGITPQQASDITTNNTKVGYTEALVSNNTSVVANTAKVGITTQQASDITTNNNKVGITSQQASDITTNNSKVGYTEALVSANSNVVANTAKVGITPTQTDAIVNNTTNIGTINTTAEFLVNKGEPSGYVPLDENSKILETYLPSSIIGSLKYIGTWNADTNIPTLPDPTTVNGNYYIVNTAGTYSSTSYGIGDWVVSNGIDWQKIDNTDAVSTVFGRVGSISANSSDYDNFYPTLTNLPNLVANNTAVVANTAKVGITTQQSADIVTNNAKVGITTQQAANITTNNSKVGITTGQANEITANTAKVGITTSQANEITANTAKVGITTTQANEITANTAKVGYTETLVSANTSVAANTAKVGITSAQANEITANTAKVGITTAQSAAISEGIPSKVSKTGDTMTGNLILGSNSLVVGGSGAANSLDDYEEGTYNIEFTLFKYGSNIDYDSSSFSSWTNYSTYVKVGRKVTLFINLHYTNPTPTNWNDSSFYVGLGNLPFAAAYIGTSGLFGVGGTWSFDSRYQTNTNTNNAFVCMNGGYNNYGNFIALGGGIRYAYPNNWQYGLLATEFPDYAIYLDTNTKVKFTGTVTYYTNS